MFAFLIKKREKKSVFGSLLWCFKCYTHVVMAYVCHKNAIIFWITLNGFKFHNIVMMFGRL